MVITNCRLRSVVPRSLILTHHHQSSAPSVALRWLRTWTGNFFGIGSAWKFRYHLAGAIRSETVKPGPDFLHGIHHAFWVDFPILNTKTGVHWTELVLDLSDSRRPAMAARSIMESPWKSSSFWWNMEFRLLIPHGSMATVWEAT